MCLLPGVPTARTITNLRLDMESAKAGKTWLLLPDGFRDSKCAKTYPLPARGSEIFKIASIYVQPYKRDSGSMYIKRALKKHKQLQQRRQGVEQEIGRNGQKVADLTRNYKSKMKCLRKDAVAAVDDVREAATEAIASLTDLFSLGRKGLAGQMEAHLNGKKWMGEKIDARAFRESFRMVAQSVGKLGLPSAERKRARESVVKEVAAALAATQDAVALSGDDGGDPPTEH